MRNSLNKGKCYERYICKVLRDNFKVSFQRVPNSGAMQTAQHLTSDQFKGDIFTEDEDWNKRYGHVIECKKVHDKLTIYDWVGFKDGRNNLLTEWINQCIKESGKRGFMLIFANDFMPDLIIVGRFDTTMQKQLISEPHYLSDWLKENVQ